MDTEGLIDGLTVTVTTFELTDEQGLLVTTAL